MLIQISCAGSPPEWVLLELQGKLAEAAPGRVLGHMQREDKGLVLRVGNHNVVGSLKDLPKALHVMQREEGAAEGAPPRLVVRCVVRRKLVFTDRPQPVISAAQGEASLGARKKVGAAQGK